MRATWLTLAAFSALLQGAASVVLRINEFGLHEAANFTRQWLHMAMPTMSIPPIQHSFDRSIASGVIMVDNITINHFIPPLIRFRPSDHSFIYMSTMSGYAQVSADWYVESNVLQILRLPIAGQIRSQMTGLISEIGMMITPDHRLEIHHCVAQIRDLRLNFSGSTAAEILHWFRGGLSRAIRKKLEQQYCALMQSHWLPWVEDQLAQFPTNLTISRQPQVVLVQSLHTIAMTSDYIDLRMKSDLVWDGEYVESASIDTLPALNMNNFERSTRMVDMLVEEQTVQSIVAAAHFAGHLKRTLRSPFLRTQCDMLCVGTVLPELRDALPNRTLRVQVDTEFVLTMEMSEKRLKGYLNMVNAQAVLIDSKIGLMSQKTIDFLVNMSTPFLEDAVDMFLGQGLQLGDPFQFPSFNEHLSIDRGCVRFETDLAIPALEHL